MPRPRNSRCEFHGLEACVRSLRLTVTAKARVEMVAAGDARCKPIAKDWGSSRSPSQTGAVRTVHEPLWAVRRPNANGDNRGETRPVCRECVISTLGFGPPCVRNARRQAREQRCNGLHKAIGPSSARGRLASFNSRKAERHEQAARSYRCCMDFSRHPLCSRGLLDASALALDTV